MQHPEVIPAIAFLIVLLIGLAVSAVFIIGWCMIWKRAGYSWALGLLMMVPLANLVAFLVLAFSRWPVQREAQHLRGLVGRSAAPQAQTSGTF